MRFYNKERDGPSTRQPTIQPQEEIRWASDAASNIIKSVSVEIPDLGGRSVYEEYDMEYFNFLSSFRIPETQDPSLARSHEPPT